MLHLYGLTFCDCNAGVLNHRLCRFSKVKRGKISADICLTVLIYEICVHSVLLSCFHCSLLKTYAIVKGQSRYPLINITSIPPYITTCDGHDLRPIERTSGNRLSAEPRDSANRKKGEAGLGAVALPFTFCVKRYMFGWALNEGPSSRRLGGGKYSLKSLWVRLKWTSRLFWQVPEWPFSLLTPLVG